MKFYKEKKDIENWLEKMDIHIYEIMDDPVYGCVVNSGSINLSNKGLKSIPVKFNKVYGYFDCSHNELKSLDFAPIQLLGIEKDFDCSYNQLKNLKGAPKELKRDFNCSHNKLISLKGCPEEIGRHFTCSNNQLTSLLGCPKSLSGIWDLSNNNLTSLKNFPRCITSQLATQYNKLPDWTICLDKNPMLQDFQDIRSTRPLLEKLNAMECEIKNIMVHHKNLSRSLENKEKSGPKIKI